MSFIFCWNHPVSWSGETPCHRHSVNVPGVGVDLLAGVVVLHQREAQVCDWRYTTESDSTEGRDAAKETAGLWLEPRPCDVYLTEWMSYNITRGLK